MKPTLAQRLAAEAIGAFTLVFAGAGAATVNTLTGGTTTHVGVAITFGLAIMIGVFAVGHISGAHFNPAVTTGLAVIRRFPWAELPAYWGAQLAGTVVAALFLRGIFATDGRPALTLPRDDNALQSFMLEIILTFFLVYVVSAVATDDRAVGPAALAIGFTIMLCAMFGGPISGASMNPARSVGPALVAGVVDHQWLYILGPLVGGVLGAITYQFVRGEGALPGPAARPTPGINNPPAPAGAPPPQRRRRR